MARYPGGMDPERIRDEARLETLLAEPLVLLFKHSPICPVSDRARRELRTFLARRPDVPAAWIDVVGDRPLSLAVAGRTGVRHESPQALLLRRGESVWDASHGAITSEALGAAWDAAAA